MFFIDNNTGVREEVGCGYPTSLHTMDSDVREITNNKAARVYRSMREQGGCEEVMPVVEHIMHGDVGAHIAGLVSQVIYPMGTEDELITYLVSETV
jgi:hypothetical protein